MKKGLTAISFVTVLLLSSCGDSGSSMSATPDAVANAPSSATLQANYATTLTEAEIQSDLEAIATANFKENLSTLDGLSNPLEEMPIFGMAPSASGQTMALARRKIMAAATSQCISLDTTQTMQEDGVSMTMTMRWYAANGSLFHFCVDESAKTEAEAKATLGKMYKSMDGSVFKVNASVTSTQVTGQMNMAFSTDLSWNSSTMELQSMKMQVGFESSFSIIQTDTFNLYVNGSFTALMDMTSENDSEDYEPTMTGSITVHLMDGRYQATVDLTKLEALESAGSPLQIYLYHNNQAVGILTIDGEGNAVVTDTAGNVINP